MGDWNNINDAELARMGVGADTAFDDEPGDQRKLREMEEQITALNDRVARAKDDARKYRTARDKYAAQKKLAERKTEQLRKRPAVTPEQEKLIEIANGVKNIWAKDEAAGYDYVGEIFDFLSEHMTEDGTLVGVRKEVVVEEYDPEPDYKAKYDNYYQRKMEAADRKKEREEARGYITNDYTDTYKPVYGNYGEVVNSANYGDFRRRRRAPWED